MDILDLRDLGKELEDLQARRDDEEQSDPLDDEEKERLAALESLEQDIGSLTNPDEPTLVNDRDFEEYAQELAEDLYGEALRGAQWPFSCIDWERAANELRADYSAVTFDGSTYLYRA